MSDILHTQKDEDIAKAVQCGDADAFTELVRRYQQPLFRFAHSLLRDYHSAQDVVQNAFLKGFINIKSFDVQRSFSSWIYRIVRNEAISLLRKQKRTVAIPAHLDVHDESVHIERDIERQFTAAHIHACIQEMPILYAEPMVLYFLEEKSYEEISDILRIPISTVGTRLRRAKQLLKKSCQNKTIISM